MEEEATETWSSRQGGCAGVPGGGGEAAEGRQAIQARWGSAEPLEEGVSLPETGVAELGQEGRPGCGAASEAVSSQAVAGAGGAPDAWSGGKGGPPAVSVEGRQQGSLMSCQPLLMGNLCRGWALPKRTSLG